MSKFPRYVVAAGAALTVAGTAGTALAHHPMGGATPGNLAEGLLSGIGHPVIGVDHLAFIVAVGVAAAFTPRSWLSPLAFVAATVIGCLFLVGGVMLPAAEFVVSASVLVVGAAILSGRAVPASAYAALFAVAGLFHGWAYGEAIVGAEATPLLAYLAGFAVTQYLIALGVSKLVHLSVKTGTDSQPLWRQVGPRLAGAVVAGVGLAFFLEAVEGAVFA